jgi:hypothetical protein
MTIPDEQRARTGEPFSPERGGETSGKGTGVFHRSVPARAVEHRNGNKLASDDYGPAAFIGFALSAEF